MANELTDVINRQTARYADREIIAYINDDMRLARTYTWHSLESDINNAACALETLGMQPGEAVAIFTANRPEFLVTDFGCYYNRCIPVSIYSTSSPDQVKYIINDCNAKMIFVGDQKQYDIVRSVMNAMQVPGENSGV